MRYVFSLLVLLIAFGLRIFQLGAKELWFDEAASVFVASKGWLGILSYVGEQPFEHSPVYYLLLNLWSGATGKSEFALRYLSVILGVVALALLYRLASWLLGKEARAVILVLSAFSPFLVWHSQEARMYSLVLCLTLLTIEVFLRALREGGILRWSLWALLSLLGILTHYYLALLILAENVLAFTYPQVPRRRLMTWIAFESVLVGLVALWVLLLPGPRTTLLNVMATSPVKFRSIAELGGILTGFNVGISATPNASVGQNLIALIPTVFVLLGIIWGSRFLAGESHSQVRRQVAILAWVLAPTCGLFLIPHVAIPRLIIFVFPPYVMLLSLGILTLELRGRIIFALGSLVLAVLFGFGLASWYSSARGEFGLVMQETESLAQPGDAIVLTNPVQWPLVAYYHRGDLPVHYIPASHLKPITPEEVDSSLKRILTDHTRIWLGPEGAWTMDPNHLVESWLNQNAYQATKKWFPESTYYAYYFAAPASMATETQEVNFENRIRLDYFEHSSPTVAVGEAWELTFHWTALEKPRRDYLVSVKLLDERGIVWSQRLSSPCSEACPTSQWQEGRSIADNHALLVPPGTPPGNYRVWLQVYSPTENRHLPILKEGEPPSDGVDLGQLKITKSSVSFLAPRRMVVLQADFGEELKLSLFDPVEAEARTGETVPLELWWQAQKDCSGDYLLSIQLSDGASNVVAQEVVPLGPAAYPTSLWEEGEIVRGLYPFTVPSHLRGGVYTILLSVAAPEGTTLKASWDKRESLAGGLFQRTVPVVEDNVTLGRLRVVERPRNFSPPSPPYLSGATVGGLARLLGYDFEQTESESAEVIRLTLYWQALASSNENYKVFTHLLDTEGRVVTQHDSEPCLYGCPTTTWVANEILMDEHVLILPPALAPGQYTLVVGMYEEASGERLPTYSETGLTLEQKRIELLPLHIPPQD